MWRGCCNGGGNRSKGDDDDAAETVKVALFDTTALLAEKAAPCIFECLGISVDSSSQIGELKKAQSSSLLSAIFYCICFFFVFINGGATRKGKKLSTLFSSLSPPSVNSLFFFL